MTVRVGLVGCGSWGQNLLRTLSQSPRAHLVAVADTGPSKLARARSIAPEASLVPSLEGALALGLDAVVIATPSSTHASLAVTALEAGADVFVEKPLALTPEDADRCASLAASLGRIGMVGHLLRYHPAVVRMISLAGERRLGELRHFASSRLRSSGDHTSSILWSLGPHDISVLRAIDASPITSLDARWGDEGGRVVLEIRLESGLCARIELSRQHPTKERRLSLVGSSLAALFDDVRAPDSLALLDAGSMQSVGNAGHDGELGRKLVHIPWSAPLALEMDHFLDCVERRASPLTPLEEGAEVVRILSRVEASGLRLGQREIERIHSSPSAT